MTTADDSYDLTILGAGLAGLTLARQILLERPEARVLVLERRESVPSDRQKVGESCVQVQGHYLGKVLDLEEVLQRDHYMKYNLRFLWRTPGRANDDIDDYSQSYIRSFSNIACYQMDRNEIEREVLRLNLDSPGFRLVTGATKIEIDLADADGPHRVSHLVDERTATVRTRWVVDATGRAQLLAKRFGLRANSPIRHGASFLWVDGLVNLEKLTDRDARGVRLRSTRRELGHLPLWLATNHFFDEGLWFWVIPLPGKTSLGLVYDREVVDEKIVSSPQGLVDWVCERFPLLARDLPHREVLDSGFFRDYAFDCTQAVSAQRWAITGEGARFSDPLYSPGGDLIALHNTLITHLVLHTAPDELEASCRQADGLLRGLYEAYVPSYATSYGAVGDPETFALKYTWELAVYFGFYVFPFVNELFTDRRFVASFLTRFARLGRLNTKVQTLVQAFYEWKREHHPPLDAPRFHDFTELEALRRAEATFYRVGVGVDEARTVLDEQLENLDRLARTITGHILSVVHDAPGLPDDPDALATLDLEATTLETPPPHHERPDHSRSTPLTKYRIEI